MRDCASAAGGTAAVAAVRVAQWRLCVAFDYSTSSYDTARDRRTVLGKEFAGLPTRCHLHAHNACTSSYNNNASCLFLPRLLALGIFVFCIFVTTTAAACRHAIKHLNLQQYGCLSAPNNFIFDIRLASL